MEQRKPDWIPPDMWTAASELRVAWGAARECQYLDRLLQDCGLRLTWKKLAKQVTNVNEWKRLLGLLANWPLSIDLGYRQAASKANEQLQAIAPMARKLAELLFEYCETTEQHSIPKPFEFWRIDACIERTAADLTSARMADAAPWQWYVDAMDHRGRASYFNPKKSELAYLLHTLADVAEKHAYDPGPFDRAALEGNASRYAAMVRGFDDILRINEDALPFHLGDTDTARLLSALLEETVSRETVANSRRRRNGNV